MMYTAEIKIEKIEDVFLFVQKANTIKGDVTVSKDTYKVDGKSVMGLFSINPSTSIVVEFEDDSSQEAEDFINFIGQFLI